MKQNIFLTLLFAGILWGCSESTSTSKKDGSSQDQYNACQGNAYWTSQGCPGYCQYNPTAPGCSGTTTGTTTSGTTSGSTTGTTGGGSYTGIPSDNNWASLYPSGEPTGTCSPATGSGYEPRVGTVTVAGGQMYSPANPYYSTGDEYSGAGYSHNTSYFFTTVADAKGFVDTDAVLKIRVKPRPQPKAPVGKTWCFGRVTGQSSDTYGYTSLKYSVSVRAVNANGSLGAFLRTYSQTTSVNSCSPSMDFSGYLQSSPNGIVVVVHDVQSLHCWYGSGCTTYATVRAASCWQMDIEAAVDGTKTF